MLCNCKTLGVTYKQLVSKKDWAIVSNAKLSDSYLFLELGLR